MPLFLFKKNLNKNEASVECVGENSASRKPWLNN